MSVGLISEWILLFGSVRSHNRLSLDLRVIIKIEINKHSIKQNE